MELGCKAQAFGALCHKTIKADCFVWFGDSSFAGGTGGEAMTSATARAGTKAKDMDGVTTHKSYCRFCHAYCAIEVDVKDGVPLTVRGDRVDPVYGGYTCIKGRQLPEAWGHKDRLRKPLKRNARGGFDEISVEQAFDEIAEKLQDIIAKNGPRSVATYCGTYAFQDSAALEMARNWHKAIGSINFYSSFTIDQPGKYFAPVRSGAWAGGMHGFLGSDVALIIGNNPVVSQYAPYGSIPPYSPSRTMQDEVKRGLKMIVVDPRRTEISQKAYLHLQIRPGQDPTFLAGLMHIILAEGLEDKEFAAAYIADIEATRAALAPYTPDYVAHRCGIDKDELIDAARTFATAKTGVATAGTGPDMAARGVLTEQLILGLNLLCGRVHREGDVIRNAGVLGPPIKRRAAPVPPSLGYHMAGPAARVRGLHQLNGEMPTAALPDEILLEGEGQVRALFNLGGNPVVAWPDQDRTIEALKSLELMVSTDVRVGTTSKLAHYILPGKIALERDDVTVLSDQWYDVPYAHYTKAVVDAEGDMIEDWELYWHLASRMGTEVAFNGGVMPLDTKPTKYEILDLQLKGSRVPLSDVAAKEGGQVFEEIEVRVLPPKKETAPIIELVGSGGAEELAEVAAEALDADGNVVADGEFSHLLISRRMKQFYNSAGHDLTALAKKGVTNPAYMNPEDLDALGIQSGEIVEVQGRYGTILGVAEAAKDVRCGVVSMAHGFGGLPQDLDGNDAKVRERGSSTNRLLSADKEFCALSGLPRQSAIPVNVRPANI